MISKVFFKIVFMVLFLPLVGACAAPRAERNDLAETHGRIVIDGDVREYIINVPKAPPPSRNGYPVLLVFHGGGGTAKGIAEKTGMIEHSERKRFIVLFPQGEKKHWNLGEGDSGARRAAKGDDVAFVRELIEKVASRYDIDRTRIYAAGLSMGGMFAYRLGCEMADSIAGIAVVAGTLATRPCKPARPVPLLHIHGLDDENVPLDGGKGRLTTNRDGWPSAKEGIEYWRTLNRCDKSAAVQVEGNFCQVSMACEAKVVSCLLPDHGHGWAGAGVEKWQRKHGVNIRQDFDTSLKIIEFFRHEKLGAIR